jgi:hypothetical protein
MRKYPQHQSGFVVMSLLVATAVIGMMIYLGFSNDISRITGTQLEAERQEWIVDNGKALDEWYLRNAWAIDSNSLAINSTTIASQAGITLKYSAQLVSSTRLNRNGVSYHVIAMWLPQTGLTGTAFDVNTGLITEGTYSSASIPRLKYHITNGATIESQLVTKSLKTMAQASTRLETWFIGQAAVATSADVNNNWFRQPSCAATADPRFLPCLAGFQDAGPVFTTAAMGAASDLVSAWGRGLLMTNDPTLVSTTHPYSVLLQAETPWGTPLQATVTESTNLTL